MFSEYFLTVTAHFAGTALLVKVLGYIFPFLTICYYTGIVELITCLLVAAHTLRFTKQYYLTDEVQPEQKAVLITGCDTGFGHELARRLDSKGFHVFACCLFPSGDGAEGLKNNCSKRLQILEMDVTKDESVKKAAEIVKQSLGENELWAVVNNAGIAKGFSIELLTIQDLRDCLEVNSIGPVRVTKTFLPFLKKSKGRVVNVISLAGRMTVPHLAPYFMSKYAVTAFNDGLRNELDTWGIRVISVEPDCFKTNILNEEVIDARFDSAVSALDEEVKNEYGEEYFKTLKEMKKTVFRFASSNLKKVVDALDNAISLEHPDIIYSPRAGVITLVGTCIYRKMCANVQDSLSKFVLYIAGFPKPRPA